MSQSTSNQANAPLCAAFVKEMREVFGDAKVIYVKEGSVELGGPDKTTVYASVLQIVAKDARSSGKAQARETEKAA